MWWMFLLRAYVISTSDWDFVNSDDVQTCMREILDLYLTERFESSPTLLVPDGSFMIDRRMAVYGNPLEIQTLFYGMLMTSKELLQCSDAEQERLDNLDIRVRALRTYVRHHYWLDRERLNEIHRFKGEELGIKATNVLRFPLLRPGQPAGSAVWPGLRGGVSGHHEPLRASLGQTNGRNAGENRLPGSVRKGVDVPHRFRPQEYAMELP
jgi:hypothetical protein